jgi:hypothetical protein
MKKKNNDRNDTLSEFIRYTRGEMTKREENAFQRKLQKDPFATEADEGYSEISPGEAADDLFSLEKKLKNKTRPHQRIIYYRIAASVAVLMIISSLYIVLEKKNRTKSLDEEIAISTPPESVKSNALSIPQVSEVQDELKKENLPETPPSGQKKSDTAAGSKTISGKDNTEVRKYISVQPLTDTNETSMLSLKADTLKVLLADQALAEKEVVQEEKDKAGELPTYPSEPAKSEASAAALKMAKADRAAGAEMDASVFTPPQPVNGQESFDNYIRQNIQKPAILTSGQTAEVVVSFIVRSSGTLDSINIISSPGKEYSDESLRLIKEGPAWKPAERNNEKIDDKVRVKIIFK